MVSQYHRKQALVAIIQDTPIIKSIYKAYRKKKTESSRNLLSQFGIEIAELFTMALANEGITTFPYFGSLLGLVREGCFLRHDDDIDMCFLFKENYSWK